MECVMRDSCLNDDNIKMMLIDSAIEEKIHHLLRLKYHILILSQSIWMPSETLVMPQASVFDTKTIPSQNACPKTEIIFTFLNKNLFIV